MQTVQQLIDAYTKCNSEVQASTLGIRADAFRRFLLKFGPLPASQIKGFHLAEWLHGEVNPKTQKPWSKGYRSIVATAIKSAFAWATELGMLDADPFVAVRHGSSERRRPLTEDEYAAILKKAGPSNPFGLVLRFLRETGCRPGEAARLEWDFIYAGQIRWGEHKTKSKTLRPRVVPVTKEVRRILAETKRSSGRVFLTKYGKPWSRRSITRAFWLLRNKIGLPKDISPHGIRHLFATSALEAGVKIHVISRILGHTKLETTIRRYLQPVDDVDTWREEMERISDARFVAETPQVIVQAAEKSPSPCPADLPSPVQSQPVSAPRKPLLALDW